VQAHHIKNMFIFFCLFFTAELKPLIILLNGASSAGKSSLAKELSKSLNNSTTLHLDTFQTEDKSLYQGIKEIEDKYEYIIVDSLLLNMKEEEAYRIVDSDICFVLVYCPLHTIAQHVQKRNKSIDKSNHRDFYEVLYQLFWIMIYHSSKKVSYSFDWILWKDFEGICSENIARKDKVDHMLHNFKKKFLHNGVLRFKPMFTYDLIVNTGIKSSYDCAQQIIRHIHSDRKRTAFYESYMKFKDNPF